MNSEPSMSSAEATREEKLLQYVERALLQNPLEDSAAIIRRRSRLLGLEAAVARSTEVAGAGNPAVERQAVLKRIEAIRSTFWSASLPELRASLAELKDQPLPDIQSTVKRLRTVASHRDQIPRLISHKAFDGDFLSVFKQVLIAAPRDSAIVKERTLAAFADRKLRRRGSKMIRLIERELPYLYELESQWMRSLVAARGKPTVKAQQDAFVDASSSSFSIPWWAWFVALMVIRAIVRVSSGE
jgi:hypothetical protein